MADDAPLRPTHLDDEGRPRMVDVSGKEPSRRTAVAAGRIRMSLEAARAIAESRTPKGDALKVAEIGGIMAGKKAGELIPLCHVLPEASIRVALEVDSDLPGVRGEARARIAGSTGVEMEALTALSVALLTVYDMVKSLDRGMVLEELRLLRKEGGRSGSWEG